MKRGLPSLGEVCPFLEQGGIAMTTQPTQKGISAIDAQMQKIFKHSRIGSFQTRKRYEKACKSFTNFLNERFKMKNLRNLQDKHVVAYIEHRQSLGIADKTIKTDLGAIRYLHDLVPNAKYALSSNAELNQVYNIQLEQTKAVKGDRAWKNDEYERMKQLLSEQAKTAASDTPKITHDVAILARTMGLRVSEAVCMRRSQAENALRTGIYQVQGEAKGGKHRNVPLSPEAREMLNERLKNIARGERVFVPQGQKAHEVTNRIRKHLERHRNAVTTSEGLSSRLNIKGDQKPLTFHGLRYAYVQDRMNDLQGQGYTRDAAAHIVTQEVGHNRIDVIAIYTNGK